MGCFGAALGLGLALVGCGVVADGGCVVADGGCVVVRPDVFDLPLVGD